MAAAIFERPDDRSLLRSGLLLTLLLVALATGQFGAQIQAEELFVTSLNFRAAYYAGVALTLLLLPLFLLAQKEPAERMLAGLGQLQAGLARLRWLALPASLVSVAVYFWLIYGFYGRFLTNAYPRLLLFWALALQLASLLAAWRRGSDWIQNLLIAALGLGLLHSASTFFIEVTDYPFSLGWSEISRYYQASFYFSQSVYGVKLPLPVTHPSRYLLQSLPFAIGSLPLWVHRLWQALLWVALPTLTAWALVKRLGIKAKLLAGMLAAWVFLYLMQGAVFYHLLPSVFIVLWGYDSKKPWRSLLVVALASLWAGISRINWAPMPGALATLLYLLDQPLDKKHPLALNYWWPPALHFLAGSLIALGSYWLYIQKSGVADVSQFGSSFTSALLWNRLWPNAAFGPGILTGILLVSAPLAIAICLRLRAIRLGSLRLAAVILILAAFFFGGLVVSVKIGGGTNLHNMDAFMVLLLALGVTLLFGRGEPRRIPASLTAAALAIPLLFAVLSGSPLNLPAREAAQAALAQIRAATEKAEQQGQPVLFIAQRHLLTFHMVDTALVHDYEKLFLMEMAISHNPAYLAHFEDDLAHRRFAYIISDPLNLYIRDENLDPLAAENNEWVREVSSRVLCYYREMATFEDLEIQILEPYWGGPCD